MDSGSRPWTDSEKIQLLAEVHRAMTTSQTTMELLRRTINELSPGVEFNPPWADVNIPGGRTLRDSSDMLGHLLGRSMRSLDRRSPYQEAAPSQQTQPPQYQPRYSTAPPQPPLSAGGRPILPAPSASQGSGGVFVSYYPGIPAEGIQPQSRKRGRPSNEQKELERQRAEQTGTPWPPPKQPRRRHQRAQPRPLQTSQESTLHAFGPGPSSATSSAPPISPSPGAGAGAAQSISYARTEEPKRRSPPRIEASLSAVSAGAQEPLQQRQPPPPRESTHYDPARGSNVPSISRRPEAPPSSYSSPYQSAQPRQPPPPPREQRPSTRSPPTTKPPARDDDTMQQ